MFNVGDFIEVVDTINQHECYWLFEVMATPTYENPYSYLVHGVINTFMPESTGLCDYIACKRLNSLGRKI